MAAGKRKRNNANGIATKCKITRKSNGNHRSTSKSMGNRKSQRKIDCRINRKSNIESELQYKSNN